MLLWALPPPPPRQVTSSLLLKEDQSTNPEPEFPKKRMSLIFFLILALFLQAQDRDQGQVCCVFPALEPGSFLPDRTCPKLSHPKPRDPAPPSHCPFPSRSPSPEAVSLSWPCVPAPPARLAQLWPHRGSIYSFYPVLAARLAPADLDLRSSRCLEPFCSWILGWRCFRDLGSRCRRCHSPWRCGRRGQETLAEGGDNSTAWDRRASGACSMGWESSKPPAALSVLPLSCSLLSLSY